MNHHVIIIRLHSVDQCKISIQLPTDSHTTDLRIRFASTHPPHYKYTTGSLNWISFEMSTPDFFSGVRNSLSSMRLHNTNKDGRRKCLLGQKGQIASLYRQKNVDCIFEIFRRAVVKKKIGTSDIVNKGKKAIEWVKNCNLNIITANLSLMVADNILDFIGGGLVDIRPYVHAGRSDKLSAKQSRLDLQHHLHVQVLSGRILERGDKGAEEKSYHLVQWFIDLLLSKDLPRTEG